MVLLLCPNLPTCPFLGVPVEVKHPVLERPAVTDGFARFLGSARTGFPEFEFVVFEEVYPGWLFVSVGTEEGEPVEAEDGGASD